MTGTNTFKIPVDIFWKYARTLRLVFLDAHFLQYKLSLQGVSKGDMALPLILFLMEHHGTDYATLKLYNKFQILFV